MPFPNDVTMEDTLLEDNERDSLEYKILMAYARRRLPASKYRKLLENEAKVQKSSPLTGRGVKTDHQRDEEKPILTVHFQGPVTQPQNKQAEPSCFPGYHLLPLSSKAEGTRQGRHTEYPCAFSSVSEGNFQSQSGESADVNHIADKLAKLVTSRSQESPSFVFQGPHPKQDKSDCTDGSEAKEHDQEKIIQSIVSLLRQKGDELEEKIKRDRAFSQCFKDMLSYNSFKRITDLFLEEVSADSTRAPEGETERLKVAYTMEVATRLTAIDNHPMNLVLGFGSKYLREHFKPWIQAQGGWEKAVASLDEEEVE
ncbi:apoptosis facilitator Bcl-2-like protein 14 [Pogoniulus pusillus]|uniref:apoptosis facilitator Bcl-2-like protein 14 n=1 Tax=Pogoniulus pusillus TaxID=488313 RepID=UPI0030B93EC7